MAGTQGGGKVGKGNGGLLPQSAAIRKCEGADRAATELVGQPWHTYHSNKKECVQGQRGQKDVRSLARRQNVIDGRKDDGRDG